MKKAVVIHNVAANGGDQLLLESLLQGLSNYCDTKVSLVTTNNEKSFAFFQCEGTLNRFFDIEQNTYWRLRRHQGNAIGRLTSKSFDKIKRYLSPGLDKALTMVEDCDFAIISPGGFMHDYYNYAHQIYPVVRKMKKLGKPVYIIGQSVGPFDNGLEDAQKVLSLVDKAIIREDYSFSLLNDFNQRFDIDMESHVTSDIALGFDQCHQVDANRADNKKVFINFRGWLGATDEEILEKAARVTELLIARGLSVEFISTCQGMPGYRDDSALHRQILNEVLRRQPDSKGQLYVNPARYKPADLIDYMAQFGSHFIGMRLHVCISAILAGLLVLNLGYEPKNVGVLKTIGLEKQASAISEDINNIEKLVTEFIESDYGSLISDIAAGQQAGQAHFKATFELLNTFITK